MPGCVEAATTIGRPARVTAKRVPGCATFSADATNYIGSGAGVIYSGALNAFPATYAAGIVDPAVGGGTETWTQTEVHIYKFTIAAGTNTAAQGLSATAGFTWEARSQ